MKLSNLTKDVIRARDLIQIASTQNEVARKSSSVVSQFMNETAERALAKGDIEAASFFYHLAAKS